MRMDKQILNGHFIFSTFFNIYVMISIRNTPIRSQYNYWLHYSQRHFYCLVMVYMSSGAACDQDPSCMPSSSCCLPLWSLLHQNHKMLSHHSHQEYSERRKNNAYSWISERIKQVRFTVYTHAYKVHLFLGQISAPGS